MIYKSILTAFIVATTATPLMAQGISGISVEWGSTVLTEDDRDFGMGDLKGTAEVSLGTQFALGASLGIYAFTGDDIPFDDGELDTTSFTLHGLYLPSPDTAFGLFVTSESADYLDDPVNAIGVEFGALTQTSKFDVYYGITDLEFGDDEYTFGGFSAEFGSGQGWNGGFTYDAFSPVLISVIETGSIIEGRRTNYAFHAGYDFSNGVGITASIGRIGLSGEEDDVEIVAQDPQSYFGLRVDYNFGPKGGTFTDNRTFLGIF
ncbi:hypothetical protein MWU60_03015 [Yoonia sp. F2084L]|uniref:hypothetical protein n=1 Tax=Yoonia sp. F2084L TaxID=2926419 RepID=UPI001FF54DE3|nr:hypothetical protein [Yoonia sp. F2084L]MCK0094530.1 hypothetical protein [Yoonia sp. F2084L]